VVKQSGSEGKANMICLTMIGSKSGLGRITIYKRELQPDGRVADVEMETFDQARPKARRVTSERANGRLAF